MSDRMGHIYVLKDPRTGEVRYVGQTLSRPEQRLAGHIHRARKHDDKYHSMLWIKSLLKRGEVPVVESVERVEEGDLDDRECHWIKFYRDSGCDLTNTTSGGAGARGHSRYISPELRAIMTENMRKTHRSPEYRARVEGQNRGSKHGISKLTEREAWEILHFLAYTKFFQREIAEAYGVCQEIVSRINRGVGWTHVTLDMERPADA